MRSVVRRTPVGGALLSIMLLITTAQICRADDAGNTAKENTELRQRVQKLEKEVEQLKKIVMQQAEVKKAEPETVTAPQLSEADLQRIMAMVLLGSPPQVRSGTPYGGVLRTYGQNQTTKKKDVWSNLDIQLYGYLKLDASYDNSRTTPGNYVKWVDKGKGKDNEFNMTARETRLGMRITGPEDGDVKTSGRVEIDFYGGGAENKSNPMMRHAYMKIDWPQERFNIIAGQTSDVISPLNPYTLNYSVLWWTGNIGYRRPQIRLTKSCELKNDVDLKVEGAIARTIGDSFVSEAGEDTGFPSLQGRVSLTFPWFGHKPTTVGVSSHWGREDFHGKEADTWSINVDMAQPINEWLAIKGEVFSGENLDVYVGGIGQGVNSITYQQIASKGGWAAASLGPWGKWSFNVGGGIDDVDADDVNTGNRTSNRSIFGNMIYSVNKNTQIGFELSHWRTEYKGTGDSENWRAQTSFIYRF